jgi:hypothetical protein
MQNRINADEECPEAAHNSNSGSVTTQGTMIVAKKLSTKRIKNSINISVQTN